jgi:multimeric flavodoxin WrbA
MKVVAFNGSPRKKSNTAILIESVFEELEKEGIKTELVPLSGKTIRGCTACYKCFENLDKRCVLKNDVVNECLEKMIEADGILLGSPTYFSNITAEMKALIDRAGMVSTANGFLLKHKVGAGVVAVRRAGSVFAFDALNHFFLYHQMIVPGSCYWNVGVGMEPGDVRNDEEGLNIMKVLGRNMAWILKKVNDPAEKKA